MNKKDKIRIGIVLGGFVFLFIFIAIAKLIGDSYILPIIFITAWIFFTMMILAYKTGRFDN